MSSIVLVRHAMPALDPEVPPEQWILSAEGRQAATALAGALPAGYLDNALLVASDEPKAYQTLEAFGAGPVRRDARFGEVRRPLEPFRDDFAVVRRAYVEGSPPPGWEPYAEVVARFDEAVTAHAGDGRLFVGTHGMVQTIWLTYRIGLVDPGEFWADLRLPDAIEVDLDDSSVHRLS